MPKSAKIHDALRKFSTASLFTSEGDELVSGTKYYANGLDALFAALTQAAIADGMDRNALMKLYMRHAEEVSRQ